MFPYLRVAQRDASNFQQREAAVHEEDQHAAEHQPQVVNGSHLSYALPAIRADEIRGTGQWCIRRRDRDRRGRRSRQVPASRVYGSLRSRLAI
eukprot:COSAG02_NODE_6542_length_3506_cov_2.178750_2_plen_93_part_00